MLCPSLTQLGRRLSPATLFPFPFPFPLPLLPTSALTSGFGSAMSKRGILFVVARRGNSGDQVRGWTKTVAGANGTLWHDHKHEQEASFIRMGKAAKNNAVAGDCSRGVEGWFDGIRDWGEDPYIEVNKGQ